MQTFTSNHVPVFTRIIRLSLFAIALFFFVACKKGDTGPQGPAGTANVVYSDWFTPSTYTVTTVFGLKNFDYRKTAPGITQLVLDSGAVLTYGKLNGYNPVIWPTGTVSLMPISINYLSGSTPNTDTWSAIDSLGSLRINLTSTTNAYSSISNAHSFRYIIIPGGTHGGRQMDLRSMTYGQVCEYLNIPQ
jgi:hypothetical protein